jgi:uncharacterized protein YndB with AHSA1/START domain
MDATTRPREFTAAIRATPERVWQALTDPALTTRYYYRAAVESTWAPGASVTYRAEDGQVLQEGHLLAVEPPTRLEFRSRLLFDPVAAAEPPFRIAWAVLPLADYCRLTLRVDGLEAAPRTAALAATLGPTLGYLRTLLETGHQRLIANVTIDCADAARLAGFWAAALGYVPAGGGPDWAALEEPSGAGPRLLFMRVPEPKVVKNRVHLDLNVEDRLAEAERLVALGARQLRTVAEGAGWMVMADPEGNEFCIQ